MKNGISSQALQNLNEWHLKNIFLVSSLIRNSYIHFCFCVQLVAISYSVASRKLSWKFVREQKWKGKWFSIIMKTVLTSEISEEISEKVSET